MFYEYALEPSVLSSWDRARFFLDAFRPGRGRFLAEYPRRWKRMVFDELNCGDYEKKRIAERLNGLDKRVFLPRAGASYDGLRSWVENALTEHEREPFRAIIAARSSGHPQVLDGADVDDTNELWRVETGQLVPRDPAVFAVVLRLLLKRSTRVVIVDPYFFSDRDDRPKALTAFCEVIAKSSSVEVHCSDRAVSYDHCMRLAERALPRTLPLGVEVLVRCWKEREGGRRLHNRYVLTDAGGVKFGDSIEHGEAGHDDHLSILDDDSRTSLWNDYLGGSPAFDPAGPPRTFVGAPRRR